MKHATWAHGEVSPISVRTGSTLFAATDGNLEDSFEPEKKGYGHKQVYYYIKLV